MGMVTVTLFKHSETDRAILVGASALSNHRDNVWLPKSQIEIGDTRTVPNPLFGSAPHIGRYIGTTVEMLVPQWLVDKNDLPEEIEEPTGGLGHD